MSYSVSINSNIAVVDSTGLNKTQYQLPLTQFDSLSPVQSVLNTVALIPAGTTQTFDLTSLGSKLLLLAIKMSRPSTVTLVLPPVAPATSDILLPSIPTTYFNYVINTLEALPLVKSVQITVPVAAIPIPTIVNFNYPNCIVELFALLESAT